MLNGCTLDTCERFPNSLSLRIHMHRGVHDVCVCVAVRCRGSSRFWIGSINCTSTSRSASRCARCSTRALIRFDCCAHLQMRIHRLARASHSILRTLSTSSSCTSMSKLEYEYTSKRTRSQCSQVRPTSTCSTVYSYRYRSGSDFHFRCSPRVAVQQLA